MLGCAGMADLAAELAATHGLPVVDGVAAAVTLAEVTGAAGTEDLPARALRGAALEDLFRPVFAVPALISGLFERPSGPQDLADCWFFAVSLFFVPFVAEL